MTRPARLRAAGCVLAAVATLTPLTTGALVAPSTGAEGRAGRTPLRVTAQTLAPAVVPESGTVTLTGQITNRSKETWTDLNAYLLTSFDPLTSRAELAAAAASRADTPVGNRLTADGTYVRVGELAPGQTRAYRLSVPRSDLGISGRPGVYWIGVHVLGAPESGVRDSVADGRVRTFIPLLPRATRRTRLALVVPVKQEVRRGAAGRLLAADVWARSLSPDGRLDRLLSISGRATGPITWVVDPAVLDAARSVALDNPGFDVGADDAGGASGSPSPTGGTGASDGASPAPGGDEAGSVEAPASPTVAANAWLEEFRRQALTHRVSTVPYGDLDVAAVLGGPHGAIYRQATNLSALTMSAFGIEASSPVLDPVSGYLPPEALARAGSGTPILLADQAFPQTRGPLVEQPDRAPFVLLDTAAGSGGARPNRRFAALPVRQRLLSDAALHALSPDRRRPLVVSTPPYWNPGRDWSASNFFAALDQPWLQLVDLSAVLSGPAAGSSQTRPVYPSADRRARVPVSNLRATRRLARTGSTFGSLLSADDSVDGVLARVAMLASSQAARGNPAAALGQVRSSTLYVARLMRQVHIEGPEFVMMSGEQGPIQVTLVNGLDQPVRVGLVARTRGLDLRISRPDPVVLGPGKRTPIRLQAAATDIGVHAVTLVATDSQGRPIGSTAQLSVRTSRVSTVIWLVMATGGTLLFLTILVRVARRIRRRKATHGPLLRRSESPRPERQVKA